MGIVTRSSAAATIEAGSPAPSPPMTSARRAIETDFVERPAAARNGDHDATAVPAGLVERGHRVGMRDHRQPQRTAHRASQRFPAERIGGAARRDHPGRAAGLGDADDGADIPRILDVHGADDDGDGGVEHACLAAGGRSASATIAARRSNRAQRGHDRRSSRDQLDAGRLEPADQLGDVIDGPPFFGHHDLLDGETRLERVGDEMRTVEQQQRSIVALRDRAKARHEGVLAAGDALHDRVFDAACVTSVAALRSAVEA